MQGYNVKRIENRGYIILAFFGKGYRIALQDMQLVMDVCPLRVDSILVRGFQDDDLDKPLQSKNAEQQASQKKAGNEASSVVARQISGVMCISILDINQPVRITESEVVRVKKRSRGLLFQSVFGSSAKKD
jgi:hypothetical protein